MMRRHRKVVITGIGLVTPLGAGRESTWRAALAGRSGVVPFRSPQAGSLEGVPVAPVAAKTPDREDRFVFLARKAAAEALADDSTIPDRSDCVIGTTKGPIERLCRLLERPDDGTNGWPFLCAEIGSAFEDLGIRGAVLVPVAACATGAYAVLEGARRIRSGACDAVLVGATEAPIVPLLVGAFCSMGVCPKPTEAAERSVRPFDLNRCGFALGEGAAMLLLEEMDSARRRGVDVYCELAGGSLGAEAFSLMQPEPTGRALAKCITEALRDAHVSPDGLDYVNAHGTATPTNDRVETAALKLALGPSAYSVAVSSTKSLTGHMLAAAGAAEIALCALALRDNVVPPTVNLTDPDPLCDLDYVPGSARERNVRVALSIAAGFGGHLAAVVLRAL